MNKRRTILAIPSDTHSGSPLGLMPPGQWQFSNGGYWTPTKTQAILSQLWLTCWQRIEALRRGARLIIVHLGDATEGLHHNNLAEVVTPVVGEHERMHADCMDQAMQMTGFGYSDGDRLYYVKGTPAHVGPAGISEENIARDLDGAVPKSEPTRNEHGEYNRDGCFVWDQLRISINGVIFDLAHHGANLSKLPWNKTNPLRAKLTQLYFYNLDHKQTIPDYWIRAHMHQAAHDTYEGEQKTVNGYVTPAFQSKTEFGHKVAADMLATMGMIWFEIDTDGAVKFHREVIEHNPDPVMEV